MVEIHGAETGRVAARLGHARTPCTQVETSLDGSRGLIRTDSIKHQRKVKYCYSGKQESEAAAAAAAVTRGGMSGGKWNAESASGRIEGDGGAIARVHGVWVLASGFWLLGRGASDVCLACLARGL